MDLRWEVGAGLVASALAVACGASSGGAPDATAHPDASADAAADGTLPEAGTDAGIDSGPSGATGDGSTGSYVVLEQNLTAAGALGDLAIALDPRYTFGLGCTQTTSGPCVLQDCSAVDGLDGGVLVSSNGGVVTVGGGNLPEPLRVALGAGSEYRPPLLEFGMFDAGAVFTVSAPGADFPAFSGRSAPAPALVTITSPSATAGMAGPTYSFEAGAPLAWTWTGASDGTSVTFAVTNASLTITCTFDGPGGGGTIPADVVAQFPSDLAFVQIVAVSSTILEAGTDTVRFAIETTGPSTYLAPQ